MFERVVERISVLAGIDPELITPETKFADLGIDSIDIVEIMIDLEDEYGVILEPDHVWLTVGDLVKLLSETVNGTGA